MFCRQHAYVLETCTWHLKLINVGNFQKCLETTLCTYVKSINGVRKHKQTTAHITVIFYGGNWDFEWPSHMCYPTTFFWRMSLNSSIIYNIWHTGRETQKRQTQYINVDVVCIFINNNNHIDFLWYHAKTLPRCKDTAPVSTNGF